MKIRFLGYFVLVMSIINLSLISASSKSRKNEEGALTQEENNLALSLSILGIDLVTALHLTDAQILALQPHARSSSMTRFSMKQFEFAQELLIKTRSTQEIRAKSAALRYDQQAAVQLVGECQQSVDRMDKLEKLRALREAARNGHLRRK